MKITLSKKQWKSIGKQTGWLKSATKYLVVDNDFNKTNYPNLIGKILDSPPAYAQVKIVDDNWKNQVDKNLNQSPQPQTPKRKVDLEADQRNYQCPECMARGVTDHCPICGWMRNPPPEPIEASSNTQFKLSKKQWKSIGKQTGWNKSAGFDHPSLDFATSPEEKIGLQIKTYIDHLNDEIARAQTEREEAEQAWREGDFDFFLHKGVIDQTPPQQNEFPAENETPMGLELGGYNEPDIL